MTRYARTSQSTSQERLILPPLVTQPVIKIKNDQEYNKGDGTGLLEAVKDARFKVILRFYIIF